jgi:hypothetical protein
MIDPDSIFRLTKNIFENSDAFKGRSLDFVSEDDYYSIHRRELTPLNLKFDAEFFSKEVEIYDNFFEPWGKDFDYPRFGLALVNQTGQLHKNDTANCSLMEWNKNNPKEPLIENDFQKPTPVLRMPSLKPLKIFEDYWYRSNVFRLEKGATFQPHIDTIVPSPWLRLWATTDPDATVVRFWDPMKKDLRIITGIEAGRIYLLDSSLVHDAYYHDLVYNLFLCLSPRAFPIIESLL